MIPSPADSTSATRPPGGTTSGWSLQHKAWAITVAVLIALGFVMALLVDAVFRRNLNQLEDQWIADTVRRTQAAQASTLDGLERACRDYANWQDTYRFIADPTQPYEEKNLLPSMFANLQLDAFVLFHRDGRLRIGRSYDGTEVSAAGIAEMEPILRPLALQAAAGPGHPVKGFFRLGSQIALVAVLPVLQDDGSGPPGGALAEVRFLNAARLASLRELLDFDLELHPREAEPALGAGPQARYGRQDRSEAELEITVPLTDLAGQTVAHWHLRLARQIHQQGAQARQLFIILIVVISAAAAVIVGALLRSLVIARIEALHDAMALIGATSDLTTRLPVSGSDEITRLTTGVNEMLEGLDRAEAERKRLHQHLLEAQKMEVISSVAGGLAHDFNNVITSIQGSATLIRLDGSVPPELEEHLQRIEKSTAHATKLVRQMLTIGHRGPATLTEVSLGAVVQEALALVRSTIPRGIDFTVTNTAASDLVLADAGQLQQVLVNLATNSSHAMAGGTGTLAIEIAATRLPDPTRPETHAAAPGAYLRLIVRDTGCGIPAEHLPRVFEAFYTTKPVGSGTGLGLSVAHSIILHHGGTIGIDSEVGRGTAIIIHLPGFVPPAPAPATPPAAHRVLPRTGKIRLLLVDDDNAVRDTLAATLSRLGYAVTAVDSGPAALQLVQADPQAFDLVVTDQMMPGMTGSELGQAIARLAPGLPLIMITGYAKALDETAVRALGFQAMLMKPVTLDELRATLDRVLRAPAG